MLLSVVLLGALVPSGAGAQSASGAPPVFAVALGSSLADVGAATLLVAAGEADAVLMVDAPGMAGTAVAELVRTYGASGFVLVGGTAAIGPAVEAELKRLAPRAAVSRVWGADREATSAQVARRVLASSPDPRGAVVALANGWSPADAAAAAAAVAAGAADAVLWTSAEALSDHAAAVLGEFSVRRVMVVGGPVAVSEPVAAAAGTAAGAPVRRVGGATRTETAVEVARVATAGRASAVVIADGWDLRAASQAAALAAAATDAVVLFSESGGALGDVAAEFLAGSRAERVYALSSDRTTRDTLAHGARQAVPQARVAHVGSAAAAAGAAIEASRRQPTQDSGNPGGSGGGSGGGGGPVTPPPTTAPPTTQPQEAVTAPTGVRVRRVSTGDIVLSWDAHPQASSLTGFEVVQAGGGGTRTLPLLPANSPSAVFARGVLDAGVMYRFTVTAVRGTDRASAAAVTHTVCARPSDARDLALTPGTGGALTITWSPPAGQNCPLSSYKVEHRMTSSSGSYTVTTVAGNATRRVELTGLADGEWGVRIKAVNPAGESGYVYLTARVGTLPMAASGVTAALSAAGEATVSWTAAPSTTQRPVSGYRVKWAESPSGANPLTFDVAATKTSLKIPNLTVGQQYSFEVASFNDDGETATGSPAAATPCEAEMPTSASVTETTGTGLSISWTLPTGLTCAISGIDLAYAAQVNGIAPADESAWTSVTVSGSTTTSATATVSDSDLTANDYVVRVRTRNNANINSPWRYSLRFDLPGSVYRWADDTPNPNHSIGRVFMMVDNGNRGGSHSAVCWQGGAMINCPPRTLVSLDINTGSGHWDNPVTVRFEVSSRYTPSFSSEHSTAETGGPSAPGDLVLSGGDGKLSAAWSTPATQGRTGASIVGYKVEYRRDLETTYNVVTIDDADARAHTITGLLNGATYYVRVRAFSDTGVTGDDCSPDTNGVWPDAKCHDGFSSSPRTARLDGDQSGTPGAPASPSVTAGDAKLSVSWSAPASDGGAAVHAYQVRHKLSTDADSAYVTRTVWSRITSLEITGLTNSSAYVVQIQALNANGDSGWTTIGTTHTPTS